MQISVLYQEKKHVLKAVSDSCMMHCSSGVHGIDASAKKVCCAGRDGAGWKGAEPIMRKGYTPSREAIKSFLADVLAKKAKPHHGCKSGLWDTCAKLLRPMPRDAWNI